MRACCRKPLTATNSSTVPGRRAFQTAANVAALAVYGRCVRRALRHAEHVAQMRQIARDHVLPQRLHDHSVKPKWTDLRRLHKTDGPLGSAEPRREAGLGVPAVRLP